LFNQVLIWEEKMMKRIWLLLCVGVFTVACGDDGGSGSPAQRVDSAISGINDINQQIVDTICTCYSDIYYEGDKNACIQDVDIDHVSLSACERAVATCYVDGFASVTSCGVDAIRAYDDCLSSCPMSDHDRQSCEDIRNGKLTLCDANTPQEITQGLQDCRRGETFVCPKS
jgi:hypothetical protein